MFETIKPSERGEQEVGAMEHEFSELTKFAVNRMEKGIAMAKFIERMEEAMMWGRRAILEYSENNIDIELPKKKIIGK